MKTQLSLMAKIYGVTVTTLLYTATAVADQDRFLSQGYTIKLYDRPLSIYAFPNQNGTANSPFVFNLAAYISKLKPEVDYRISNRTKGDIGWFTVAKLPAGVSKLTEGEGVCQDNFPLNSAQSCVLRLLVDKTKFTNLYLSTPGFCFTSGPPYYFPAAGICLWPAPSLMLGAIIDKLPEATVVTATPQAQDGLRFDPVTLAITGTPTRAGLYRFKIGASNNQKTAASQELSIYVQTNVKDKPVFKPNPTIASAMPSQSWQLNLLELLEPRPGFMLSNQVSFRIEKNLPHPDWLSIDEKQPTILKGRASAAQAGQTASVTLVASSNTGGESEPMTIHIPVAFDLAKKPRFKEDIHLAALVGTDFHHDFRASIIDPTADANMQLLLDKVEPAGLDVKVSPYNPTELYGVIDEKDEGREYKLVLRAKTAIGGVSEPVTVPLSIAINPALTPQFYQDTPVLSPLFPGQAFRHNFVENRDVHPEYEDVPYVVELVKNRGNPAWLRIENNVLIADQVPEDLPQQINVYVTIKNTPGGRSVVYPLLLNVMD